MMSTAFGDTSRTDVQRITHMERTRVAKELPGWLWHNHRKRQQF